MKFNQHIFQLLYWSISSSFTNSEASWGHGGCVLKHGCWINSFAGGLFSLLISRQRRARSRVLADSISGTVGGPLLVAICNKVHTLIQRFSLLSILNIFPTLKSRIVWWKSPCYKKCIQEMKSRNREVDKAIKNWRMVTTSKCVAHYLLFSFIVVIMIYKWIIELIGSVVYFRCYLTKVGKSKRVWKENLLVQMDWWMQ